MPHDFEIFLRYDWNAVFQSKGVDQLSQQGIRLYILAEPLHLVR